MRTIKAVMMPHILKKKNIYIYIYWVYWSIFMVTMAVTLPVNKNYDFN